MAQVEAFLEQHKDAVFEEWWRSQLAQPHFRRDLLSEAELRSRGRALVEACALALLQQADGGGSEASWAPARRQVEELAESQGAQGFSVSEVARFVFSFKEPFFAQLQQLGLTADELAVERSKITRSLDDLGLHASEVHQRTREQVIQRQQREILELSTPVLDLWAGVLLVPLIGTLDSQRTQAVMEALLRRIVETRSRIAVLDITGVPTVDTLVAQHLMKTVAAARLMGADCIISGIRPAIAQTIVHLGVDLSQVVTRATMADAFSEALQRVKARAPAPAAPEAPPAEAPAPELH